MSEQPEYVRPDDPVVGWSGIHTLTVTSSGGSTTYHCACGRSSWRDADTVRTHIEWALAEQNKALWNAGQRVCNDEPEAIAELGSVLQLCLPAERSRSTP